MTELLGSGGDSVWMQPPFDWDCGSDTYPGESVYFDFKCVSLDVCKVKVGDFTLFDPAMQIDTGTHHFDARLRRTQEFARPVFIGAESVVGAGCVLAMDIPDGVVAVGNPCRIIRETNESENATS